MRKKGAWINILIILAFVTGLSLLLYPIVSNWWNARHQTREVHIYSENVAGIDRDTLDEYWDAAAAYNRKMAQKGNPTTLIEEQQIQYEQTLNVAENGMMGYIEIPSMDIELPIYHGTEETTLQRALGHIEWSSLPVGGESTHSVTSGHRGLPSSKLFTDLDKVVEGDIFTLQILDRILTYEVDQILIVEPQDISALQIVKGKDYCTLVTCTPYGINTHRMLVRGHRIDNIEEEKVVRLTSEAVQVDPMIVAIIVAAPMLVLLLILVLLKDGGQRTGKKKKS